MIPMRLQTMRLTGKHVRNNFQCGEPDLDRYLKKQAGQDMKRGVANIFVATAPESWDILGFYSLSAHSIDLTALPETIIKKLPRYGKVPAVLLGRLAVDGKAQGQKLGAFLLYDALARAVSGEIGWVIFLVQAKHDNAANFYRHLGFCSFKHDPLTLYIHRKTAESLVAGNI